jgi:large subunit ribosomal protein L21
MKYAILESGGKQYRAVEGATIEVDRLPQAVGERLSLGRVLLLVDGEQVAVGTPTVSEASVTAMVVEHVKGPREVTFRYRPKKRIRRKIGHRQAYTRLLIEQIGGAASGNKEQAASPA